MCPAYHLNAKNYSLKKLQSGLESRSLIPSRVILKENIKENFKLLKTEGLITLEDLLATLKNKKRIVDFSDKTGLPADYLTVLKREASSFFSNPIQLSKFSEIDDEIISKLANQGIKNSKHLFDATTTKENTSKLALVSGLKKSQLVPIIGLCDLSRLYGVGPVFAQILYNVGIDSVQKFLSHTAKEIVKIYEDVEKKKADFSASDIQFAIEVGKYLE